MIGYVDAIAKGPMAGDLHLIDFKTAGRRWAKGRERKELQARVYTGALWQSGVSFAHLTFAYWVFVPGLTPEACAVHRLPALLSERDVLPDAWRCWPGRGGRSRPARSPATRTPTPATRPAPAGTSALAPDRSVSRLPLCNGFQPR